MANLEGQSPRKTKSSEEDVPLEILDSTPLLLPPPEFDD